MQQVNLYTAEFKPKQIILPFSQLVAAAAAMGVVLTVLSVLLAYQQSGYHSKLSQLQANNTAMQAQVEKQRNQLAGLKPDQLLVSKRNEIQQKLDQGRHMVGEFEALALGEFKLFSPYFIGLARQTKHDIWLTQITLEGPSRYLRLEGRALNAQAVPNYLARLKDETVFAGSRFASFNVDTQTVDDNGFGFVLESASNPRNNNSTLGNSVARVTGVVSGGQGEG